MARRRRNDSGLEGVLLVDKPTGLSSHDVVAKLRRALGTSAVGHTGTLDPFASGLLVVVVGRYTRLSPYLTDADKRYLGEVCFGRATNTDDVEGEVIAEGDPSALTEDAIRAAMATLTGPIRQTPPVFSAISVGGERLYEKARRGEAVEVPERDVVIHRFDLVGLALPTACVDVECSKGTYIRALARDLGERLGVPAHLSALRRTASGGYTLDEAATLEALQQPEVARDRLLTGRAAVRGMDCIDVASEEAADLRQGRSVAGASRLSPGNVALAFDADEPVAVVRADGDRLLVARGFGARP